MRSKTEENTLVHIVGLLRRSRLAYRWRPALLWMANICYFSSRSVLPSPFRSPSCGSLLHATAHSGEYAILSALLCRAMASAPLHGGKKSNPGGNASPEPDTNSPSRHRPLALAFVAASLFAVVDELHQSFVPDRGFGLDDIGYDLVGITAALGLIWMRERGRMDGGEG